MECSDSDMMSVLLSRFKLLKAVCKYSKDIILYDICIINFTESLCYCFILDVHSKTKGYFDSFEVLGFSINKIFVPLHVLPTDRLVI